jgi:hypothetical protein
MPNARATSLLRTPREIPAWDNQPGRAALIPSVYLSQVASATAKRRKAAFNYSWTAATYSQKLPRVFLSNPFCGDVIKLQGPMEWKFGRYSWKSNFAHLIGRLTPSHAVHFTAYKPGFIRSKKHEHRRNFYRLSRAFEGSVLSKCFNFLFWHCGRN